MHPPKKVNVTVIASITVASAFMFPTSAFAHEKGDISVAQIDMQQLNGAANPDGETASESKVKDYLASQARQGNLVDEKEVMSASVESPLDGSSVDLVWNDSMSPTEMNLSLLEGEGEKASQVGLGVAMKHNEVDMDGTRETPIGMGYGAASDIDGMYLFSQDCFNAYFGPNYDTVDDEDHYMTTCYQKFAESGTVNWVYNRWGHWETAEPVTGTAVALPFCMT
ncbi:hypothetical protein GCM10007147_46090 [Nocardiopsis kunsanensis]|uniref:Uncharacterized protein n=1 Tax=Nocardiopsis kunsanensis TaxID=141693 RepID=A0A918XLE9_9ACTN|nr:hypothetical protein [Nocardiopsis kunsanensis]GHD37967.1 hypothetical protein GCM10007147_46090 [Nocardiopsis kunsanensis]